MDPNLYLPIAMAGRHDNETFDKNLHSSNHRRNLKSRDIAIETEGN